MKKIKTLLLTAVMMMTAMSTVFAGCGGTTDNGSATDSSVESVEQEGSIVTLNAFENHVDLDTVWFNNLPGKMELNKSEKDYIKEGEASAKLTIDSDPYKPLEPKLTQALKLTKKKKDYTDFSFTRFVTIDVYNASEETKILEMQLEFQWTTSSRESFELAPQAWTTVQYSIEREYILTDYGTNEHGELYVKGLNMYFDRSAENDVYYLDNMKFYKTGIPAVPVVRELEENEFCSFDKIWQTRLVGGLTWVNTSLLPEFSYTSDNTATGYGSALRMKASAAAESLVGNFTGLQFSDKLIKMFPWSEYDDNDCFCFEVYSPEGNGIPKIWFNMFGQTSANFYQKIMDLPQGKWITVSIPISTLNLKATEQNSFADMKIIQITYQAAATEQVLYLDNFRVEVN